jgi:myo-inositol-1(or 4)-monophosphatase
MKRFRKVAIEAARASGLFIKMSVGKTMKISYKGRINIVTDVDKKSEAMITERLCRAFPSHSILAEEESPQDRASSYRWIIDPLDGTTNFAHGFPFFSVSIALERAGEAVLGIVYDPMRDELFSAEKGKGAYLNTKKISVSDVSIISHSLLSTGFSYGVKGAKNTNLRNFGRALARAQAIRRAGSAALDMCYVACGRFDGFWEMDLQPWDTAAASLIVKEAKGRVTRFDGSRYSHYDQEVLATNSSIHKQMVGILS